MPGRFWVFTAVVPESYNCKTKWPVGVRRALNCRALARAGYQSTDKSRISGKLQRMPID